MSNDPDGRARRGETSIARDLVAHDVAGRENIVGRPELHAAGADCLGVKLDLLRFEIVDRRVMEQVESLEAELHDAMDIVEQIDI